MHPSSRWGSPLPEVCLAILPPAIPVEHLGSLHDGVGMRQHAGNPVGPESSHRCRIPVVADQVKVSPMERVEHCCAAGRLWQHVHAESSRALDASIIGLGRNSWSSTNSPCWIFVASFAGKGSPVPQLQRLTELLLSAATRSGIREGTVGSTVLAVDRAEAPG